MKTMAIGGEVIVVNEENHEKPGFKYSMFTKTGTPLYTAPEMQYSVKYS